MRLGDKTALVTFPAEVFVELGQEVKQKAADRGFLYTFVCGYTNDAMGYVCTKRVCLWNGRLRNGS